MRYKSLIEHPLWDSISKHVDIENNNAKNGWRINVLDTIPVGLAKKAMKIKVICSGSGCTELIHPIREGSGWGNLYIASTCPQTKTIKCSRTKGAILGCAIVRGSVAEKQINIR